MKRLLKDYTLIAVGTALIAFGITVFLIPGKLSSGGVSSIGTILLYLFHIPLSVTNLVCNAVLFLLGYHFLGRESILKTVVGILLFSLFVEIASFVPAYSDDRLIAALCGGVLIGVGVGLVVRCNASTGGSDFAGMILHRFFPHLSLATLIMILDTVIVAVTGIVFRSFTVTIYSGVALFVAAKATDFVLAFGDVAKSVSVFSECCDTIAARVMETFGRGVTGVFCKGMYTGNERTMLLCVVSPKELPRLIRLIRDVDSGAFIIINDAREVLGEGFKEDSLYRKS